MSNFVKLIDNSSEDLHLVSCLRRLFSSGNYRQIKIATGYWDLPGMKLIQDELQAYLAGGGKLFIMIGEEPTLREYQLRSDLTKEEKFPDFYIQNDVNKLNDEYVGVATTLLKYCNLEDENNSQVQIRVYGQNQNPVQFLHAKCYIFLGEDSKGIIGSSNFTQKGLEGNAELNYLETNSMVVTAVPNEYSKEKGHNYWFDEKWSLSQPWTGKFIKEILLKSPVGKKAAEMDGSDANAENLRMWGKFYG